MAYTIRQYQTKSGKRYEVRYRKPDGTATGKRGFKRKMDADAWGAANVTTAKSVGAYIALPRMIPKKHIYLSVDQLLALADASGWHRPIVLTLGLCGLRWGELVGLQVGDVDFERQRIHVLRTVSEIRDHFVVGTTKTGETRTVIFPSLLRPCLEEACAGRRPSDLLFPDRRTGSYLRRAHGRYRGDWFCRAKRAVLDEDAAASMTVHDLRHTCASLLVHAGANVKAVQRQLGHKSAAMTLDVYADLFDDDLDAVGEAMNGLLVKAIGEGRSLAA